MCEACANNHEASELLQMLISKIHASNKDGGARLRIDLAESEMDRLCAWDAADEDVEDDDPPEDDGSPEESEHLESDCRVRFGEGETTDVAGLLWRRGERVIVEIGETEIVGTVRAHKLGADWPRYTIELSEPPGATLEVDSCCVYPAKDAA